MSWPEGWTVLPQPPGTGPFSGTTALSADGSVIVGWGGTETPSVQHPVSWTQSGGIADMGEAPNDPNDSVANGVSGDGSIIVGGNVGRTAWSWTAAGGFVDLSGGQVSWARGISTDGSTIVGARGPSFGSALACYWQGGVPTSIGCLPGDATSDAWDASADGTVIVGGSQGANGSLRAFRWTAATGMVDLGFLPGGVDAEAFAVSADGSVVVGAATGANHPFRWTQAGGMVDLGVLPGGGNGGYAVDVSPDGNTALCIAYDTQSNANAAIWTQADGMVALPMPDGLTEVWVTALSGDGTCISAFSDDETSLVYRFPAPSSASATLAELFFASTASFVDFSVAANRRKFISDVGSAPPLGADGSTPFGVTPPVFLSAVLGDPEQFTRNNGLGGEFILTGEVG